MNARVNVLALVVTSGLFALGLLAPSATAQTPNCLIQRARDYDRCADLKTMSEADVTAAEVRRVALELDRGDSLLSAIWSGIFTGTGLRFAKPALSFYGLHRIPPPEPIFGQEADWMEEFKLNLKSVNSFLLDPPECDLPLENAVYCPTENAIYYDLIFLTQLAKAVGAMTGTSGTYAAVTALAHEMGHAVDYQAGMGFADLLFLAEVNADCFAGAAIAEMIRIKAGSSRAVQVLALSGPEREEGQLALWLLGSETSADGLHPSGAVRQEVFTKGYDQGASVCAFGKVEAR